MQRTMPTDDPHLLRQILLLQSLEETDALGKVLPLDSRERATRECQEGADFLTTRTQRLLSLSSEGVQQLAEWMSHPTWRWWKWVQVGVPVGALLVGWLTNELGTERIVNILAFPLLGLILWNIFICTWMFLAVLRPRPLRVRPWPEQRMRAGLEQHLGRKFPDPQAQEIISRSALRFLRRWRARTAGQMQAQVRVLLHGGALLLALGLVASMYAQGLRREYQAGWESTFLQPAGLHRLLGTVLGPASALSGISLPPPAVLAQMQLHPGAASASTVPQSAAPFIHLWAITAGLFIGLPRLLLIILARRESSRLRPDWSPDLAAYRTALGEAAAGQVKVVDVLPVYVTLEAASAEAIRRCILQRWGGKTRVHFLRSMELGEETEYLTTWQPAPHGTVLTFSFASTPEQDVQGEVVQAVAARASELLVVTDALSFEARHGTLPEYAQRLTQRTAAWQRLLGQTRPWLNLTTTTLQNPLQAMDGLGK